MDAQDAAFLMLKGKNPLNAALGIAVCNAAADYDALSSKVADAADAFAARADDVVGMVGNIKPVAKQLKPEGRETDYIRQGRISRCLPGRTAEGAFTPV